MSWFREDRNPIDLFVCDIKPLDDAELLDMYARIRSELIDRQNSAKHLIQLIDEALIDGEERETK